jgi:hypothetical protein
LVKVIVKVYVPPVPVGVPARSVVVDPLAGKRDSPGGAAPALMVHTQRAVLSEPAVVHGGVAETLFAGYSAPTVPLGKKLEAPGHRIQLVPRSTATFEYVSVVVFPVAVFCTLSAKV